VIYGTTLRQSNTKNFKQIPKWSMYQYNEHSLPLPVDYTYVLLEMYNQRFGNTFVVYLNEQFDIQYSTNMKNFNETSSVLEQCIFPAQSKFLDLFLEFGVNDVYLYGLYYKNHYEILDIYANRNFFDYEDMKVLCERSGLPMAKEIHTGDAYETESYIPYSGKAILRSTVEFSEIDEKYLNRAFYLV